MVSCLITGVTLYDEAHRRTVRGDLFRIGDCYVINCVMMENNEPRWDYEPADLTKDLVVVLPPEAQEGGTFFERRGVVVVDLAYLKISENADNYMNQGVRP